MIPQWKELEAALHFLKKHNEWLETEYFQLKTELTQYKQWVADLQSEMYVNCVYCGHRYGPIENTPVSMADMLKEHIEECPQHPMSHLKRVLQQALQNADIANRNVHSGFKPSDDPSI